MTDPLAGVRAIVTGGASGMGAGIVGAYAAHGAQVISLDLQAGPGAEIAEKATAAGPGSAAFLSGRRIGQGVGGRGLRGRRRGPWRP